MAQSQNTKVDLTIPATMFVGLTTTGSMMVGDKALEYYNERNVEDYIQIPWDQIDHVAASVMFGGRLIPRFAIFTKQNGHYAFSTRNNHATLRAIRDHVGNEKVVRSLAETGNISLAAKNLYISQSAVSQSIKQLETALQARLFARSPRGVTLTGEGQLLYQYVRSALGLIATGEDKLSQAQQLLLGTLTEGDLLWYIRDRHDLSVEAAEKESLKSVKLRRTYTPVTVDVAPEELFEVAINQNFVPVLDDNGFFIGIVTRKTLLTHLMKLAGVQGEKK